MCPPAGLGVKAPFASARLSVGKSSRCCHRPSRFYAFRFYPFMRRAPLSVTAVAFAGVPASPAGNAVTFAGVPASPTGNAVTFAGVPASLTENAVAFAGVPASLTGNAVAFAGVPQVPREMPWRLRELPQAFPQNVVPLLADAELRKDVPQDLVSHDLAAGDLA